MLHFFTVEILHLLDLNFSTIFAKNRNFGVFFAVLALLLQFRSFGIVAAASQFRHCCCSFAVSALLLQLRSFGIVAAASQLLHC